MLDRNKLRGAIASSGLTQKEVAIRIGISEVSFSRKMKSGSFDLNEIDALIKELRIKHPASIFFAQEMTSQVK